MVMTLAASAAPAMVSTSRRFTGKGRFRNSHARTAARKARAWKPADNLGVLLRRTLDYAVADQRAEVLVKDADRPAAPFRRAGTWLTAGSTRSLYANARTENGPVTPEIIDIPRRWRDDECLVARSLTRGVKNLRVRISVMPNTSGILAADPPSPALWTEVRYRAYAWTLPASQAGPRGAGP